MQWNKFCSRHLLFQTLSHVLERALLRGSLPEQCDSVTFAKSEGLDTIRPRRRNEQQRGCRAFFVSERAMSLLQSL